MNAALWGIASALGWGGADFFARFSGRKLGPTVALFGMLLVGVTALTIAVLLTGLPPRGSALGWALVVFSGAATVVAMLLLYDGLARGPVTIVAPIVGAYPVLNIAFSLARGARPELLQWAAMAAVLAGVAIVARSAGHFEQTAGLSRADIRRSIGVALGGAVGFGLALGSAQETIPVFGELQTVWLGRIVSFTLLSALFAVRRRTPRIPAAWWPLVALQGLMDAGAYVSLLFGGHGPGSEIAVVVSSSFSVVTVLLARIFLREAMSLLQWVGVATIVGGVAVLAAIGK
jgi:drug/metabolite transporter (DMT)-like permease